MKRITDKSFKYVPAAETDIRKTFDRIRREQKAKEERERQNAAERLRKCIEMKSRKA